LESPQRKFKMMVTFSKPESKEKSIDEVSFGEVKIKKPKAVELQEQDVNLMAELGIGDIPYSGMDPVDRYYIWAFEDRKFDPRYLLPFNAKLGVEYVFESDGQIVCSYRKHICRIMIKIIDNKAFDERMIVKWLQIYTRWQPSYKFKGFTKL